MALRSDFAVLFLFFENSSRSLAMIPALIAVYVHNTPLQTEMDGNIVSLPRWIGLEASILVAEPTNIFGLVGIFPSQDSRYLLLDIIHFGLQLVVGRGCPS